jgi:hypothetical protein
LSCSMRHAWPLAGRVDLEKRPLVLVMLVGAAVGLSGGRTTWIRPYASCSRKTRTSSVRNGTGCSRCMKCPPGTCTTSYDDVNTLRDFS